jgi:hypothetical protein
MKASKKVKLIKEIATTLSQEDWSLIDLTLKEFEFPISETYNGKEKAYVIEHLQNGNENNLIELAEHLGLQIENESTVVNPDFWKDDYFKLFISHLATDKVNAQKLKDRLEIYGISGFVAHSDIEPTKEWQNEIEVALRTCDSLVALMIKDFHNSNWTDQEIGLALGRDLLIIPVRMGQDPYGFIGKFQAITYNDINSLADEIFQTLQKNKKTNHKIASSIIYKFENSDSFATAKSNISLIEENTYWDKALIRRLQKSIDNNSQIKHSFGVPEKVLQIIRNNKLE